MVARSFVFGSFVFDVGRGAITCDGVPLSVGHRGLAILHALLKEPGRIVTKAELLDAAWPGVAVEESNLSVQIANLRKCLGSAKDGSEWIATVPRVGYRFAHPVSTELRAAAEGAVVEPREAGRKPSIAVLPFSNQSGEPEQEYFGDGLTEDIINALSRFRWFLVVTRHSSFRFKGMAIDLKEIAQQLNVGYILSGSVRKSGSQIRVSAHLSDARTGHQLWADRYDVQLGDVFGIQDRIAEQVAGAIEPELLKSESVIAARRRHAGDADSMDLVYQGAWFFHKVTRATHLRARELFRKARELDPELPEANLWLARVNAGLVAYGWSEDPKNDMAEALDAAVLAVQIDEKNPYAHYALAIASMYAGLFDQAARAAEKALELSPSFALAYLALGLTRLFSGAASEAIEPLERGLHLNPFDPQNFVWLNALALAQLFANKADRAHDTALKSLQIRPLWRSTLATLTCCYVKLGNLRAARESVEQIERLDTPASDVFFDLLRQQNPGLAEELRSLLLQAGLKESKKADLHIR
jgi:TolB-like protein/Flp pilus assembly protein TadD